MITKNQKGARIQKDKTKIITMYQEEGISVTLIAREYDVAESTIYIHMKKWGIVFKSGDYKVRKTKASQPYIRKFSPEVYEQIKKNSEINNIRIENINTLKNTKITKKY